MPDIMEVKFTDYRFLRDKLILYRGDEVIPLKRNQALLLDFFLTDPRGIYSKDEILDAVWKNKVVSEQVVFQTISQLRAILGDNAIKTFSKKGYQWQLPLEFAEPFPDSDLQTTDKAPAPGFSGNVSNPPVSKDNTKRYLVGGMLSGSLVISVLLIVLFVFDDLTIKKQKIISVNLLTSQSSTDSEKQFTQTALTAINQARLFKVIPLRLQRSSQQVFNAPRLSWAKAQIPDGHWLLWGTTYTSEQGSFLHYGLTRGEFYWQGYVYAKDPLQLGQTLAKRLGELERLGLFATDGKPLSVTDLKSMYEKAPDDPDILLKLAQYYTNIEHNDVALAHLEKLIRLDESYGRTPYRASALWQVGRIYKHRTQYLQANDSLEKMAATLKGTPLWPHHFKYIQTKAWLTYAQTQYEAMFETLEQGLALGNKLADPLALFELHILYSILAQNANDDEKKYEHLNHAQAVLLKHQLDESNMAVVYYHFALFSKEMANKAIYLERILELPTSEQNYWVKDAALERLINYYIDTQDYNTAYKHLNQAPLSSRKLLLKAKVHLSQEQIDPAVSILHKAYDQARLDYDIQTGVQAALKLYQLTTDSVLRAKYLAYIESNASDSWLRRHEVTLTNH